MYLVCSLGLIIWIGTVKVDMDSIAQVEETEMLDFLSLGGVGFIIAIVVIAELISPNSVFIRGAQLIESLNPPLTAGALQHLYFLPLFNAIFFGWILDILCRCVCM